MSTRALTVAAALVLWTAGAASAQNRQRLVVTPTTEPTLTRAVELARRRYP